MTIQVVFDAPLLVEATSYAGVTWLDWPAVPPVTGNHSQDALGVIASASTYEHDWALILSPTLIKQVGDTLTQHIGLQPRDVAGFISAVGQLAVASGGSVVSDPPSLGTGHAPQVAAPLELAHSGRRLLVTTNPALVQLGPVWGPDQQPILCATGFVDRVDAARRVGDI